MAEFTDDLCDWLKQSHFVNYCFISYPRVDPNVDDDLRNFAVIIRNRLTAELEHAGADNLLDHLGGNKLPEVFMDDTIPPGAEWPDDLRDNLQGSVSMVAVLTPAYFRRKHEWCGKEWSAMLDLGTARLRNTATRPIIPVCYRETELPLGTGRLQKIDLSRLTTSSRDYHTEPEFRRAVLSICDQIIQIALELRTRNSAANEPEFSFPQVWPFGSMPPPMQPPPLRA